MPYHVSRMPGFYRLSLRERIEKLGEYFDFTAEEVAHLRSQGALKLTAADKMIENVVGIYSLPIGLGLNLTVNGRDYLVPMAVEEASIVAAVSSAAKIARGSGGFSASADRGVMIGQIHVLGAGDPTAAAERIVAAKRQILELADGAAARMKRRGGGALDLEVRILDGEGSEPALVVHLLADCLDAMGANAVNTMTEAVAPKVAEVSGGEVLMRILSNLADRRLARAEVRIATAALTGRGLDGAEVARRIAAASRLAQIDPYRAATHNKGIMNGIDAVAVATGNDWRSIEAGAHAFACRDGSYRGLARWQVDGGELVGTLTLPLAVGILGGNIDHHPMAQIMLRLLRTRSSRELAGVMVCCGLAQNLGALRALVVEGIQSGHMALHARSVALSAGAEVSEVDELVERLKASGEIKVRRARQLLAQMRGVEESELEVGGSRR